MLLWALLFVSPRNQIDCCSGFRTFSWVRNRFGTKFRPNETKPRPDYGWKLFIVGGCGRCLLPLFLNPKQIMKCLQKIVSVAGAKRALFSGAAAFGGACLFLTPASANLISPRSFRRRHENRRLAAANSPLHLPGSNRAGGVPAGVASRHPLAFPLPLIQSPPGPYNPLWSQCPRDALGSFEAEMHGSF
jgi:hypothetical protein